MIYALYYVFYYHILLLVTDREHNDFLTISDRKQWLAAQRHEIKISDAMWSGSYVNDARLCMHIADIMNMKNCPSLDGVGRDRKVVRVRRTPPMACLYTTRNLARSAERTYRNTCPPSWKLIPACVGLPPRSFDKSQMAKRDP